MDVDAFLPLRGEEITDIGLARRMINYSDVIDAIVERLKVDGVADTQGLRPTHGYYSAGRYLRLHRRFGAWMGVDSSSVAEVRNNSAVVDYRRSR